MWLRILDNSSAFALRTKLINADNITEVAVKESEDASFSVVCTYCNGSTQTLCRTDTDGTDAEIEQAEYSMTKFINEIDAVLHNNKSSCKAVDITGKQIAASNTNFGEASILGVSVKDMGLGARESGCLLRAGITTLGDLTRKTRREIEHLRGIGVQSAEIIVRKMSEFGVAPVNLMQQ